MYNVGKKRSGYAYYTNLTEGPFDEFQGPLVTQVLMLYERKEGRSKFPIQMLLYTLTKKIMDIC
jgi:hypothetical protein